ncbi:MAG TPA: tRNA (N(6)-L-threonylcarbamoyladenosine(37)-C(2))-methylthiotransferase MtaB, partial [Clostridia bacterium]|nr:tRNA (N(6)-L-threonylcarbamoyladenosine(37)-C(2))-methylthiotransferase MtaB [Clostridia bacterium]
MKAVVFNLGCKVNQYECDIISEALIKKGYSVANSLEYADLYIINTCAVTNEAERKSRQAVSRCQKYNPDAKIIVCGCASEKTPVEFLKSNVTFITGVANKKDLLSHLDDKIASINISKIPDVFEDANLELANRTRAYIKIQDGCNNFCSYCIIPYLRGRSRSRNIKDIVLEAKNLALSTKEIVITGINLQQYGEDIGVELSDLIIALKDIDVRIRLGSFYVEAVNEKLLSALFSLKHFCPHFHLSLQSGSDSVLKSMNRKYTTSQYLDRIRLIRSFDANASITTDIIVGYPTETEENFEETLKFVNQVGFSDIHIFPFSARKGTVAEKLPILPKNVISLRKEKLNIAKNRLKKEYLTSNLNVSQNVIFEEQDEDYFVGYSERYIRVYSKIHSEIGIVVPKDLYK